MFGSCVAKTNRGFSLVILTANVDDDAFAERWMLDIVAESQADELRVGRGRLLPALSRSQCCLHHSLPMSFGFTVVLTIDAPVRRRIGPLVARSIALPSVRAAPADRADLVDQRPRYLIDEPRRRVVVGVPEQLAAPGMSKEQPLLGTGDADVGEPSFLFQFDGLGERPSVREHALLHPDEEHRRELQPLGRMQ